MARVSEIYGGNWLTADDLAGREVVVTIESVSIHDMPDNKKKAALHFVGKEKALLLNVTNGNAIAELTGTDEMDNWEGQRIKLYVAKVDFQGKRVPAIRVKEAASARPAPPPPPAVDDLDDDAIPFAWALPLVLPMTGMLAYFV
jgi:hypothetical protein